jgi:hypothetical protein
VIALRTLGYLWALPGTILGAVLGATTLTRPTMRDGVLVFQSTRGFAALHRRLGFTAITLGHVMIVNAEPSDGLWAHERVHVRQWEILGPLMIVAYPLASLAGYRRNPFEAAARRRAGR